MSVCISTSDAFHHVVVKVNIHMKASTDSSTGVFIDRGACREVKCSTWLYACTAANRHGWSPWPHNTWVL